MGQSRVTQERQGDILVLVIDQPPVNALSHPLRLALSDALRAAQADPDIAAIVIRAEGRSFAAGADITEHGKPTQAPLLSDLCAQIESGPKPVVAALQATALGGGLELALAAHGRVALVTAQVGLPEVNLGILPGAGGTQRLPRLIGAEQALRLMLAGTPITAAEALALGLLDHVVEGDLQTASLDLARSLIGKPLPRSGQCRIGMRDGLAYQNAIVAARNRLGDGRLPAPLRIVECVEAAQLLPIEQGLTFERAAYDDLVATPEAAALRYAFLAERRAARFPESATVPRDLQRIGVMGVGAVGLVLPLLLAGFPVVLVDGNRPALVTALEQIAAGLEQHVVSGALSETARDGHWARLTPALGVAAFADADLVVVAEAEALREAAEGTTAGVVLALTGRGAGIEGPRARDMLGLRLIGAENRLAEMMVGPQTEPKAVATLAQLCRKIGRGVVRSAAPGGVAGRVMVAGRAAVLHLRNAAVAEADLAAALTQFGLPMLLGSAGAPQKGTTDTARLHQITAQVLAAMANEGSRLLGRGMALRPSDIDFALVAGYGFPRWEGGPMHWADQRGLMVLRKDLRAWASEGPELWTPAPLFDSLISDGRKLADLT